MMKTNIFLVCTLVLILHDEDSLCIRPTVNDRNRNYHGNFGSSNSFSRNNVASPSLSNSRSDNNRVSSNDRNSEGSTSSNEDESGKRYYGSDRYNNKNGHRNGGDKEDDNKGGIMFPGTKWCGSGDRAENDSDIGYHEETDKCCRAHDKCPDIIEAGESKYGLKNDDFYTRLNCQCDLDFHRCLKSDDSKASHYVGNTYFNILTSRCFRKDYPIVKCTKEEPGKMWTRCLEYEQDRSRPKEHQWFDNPAF